MAVLGLRFCARAFPSCGKRGPLLIAVRGPLLLRSTGSRRAGSVIVAHGPSCSAACGILPDQGSNPCPLHWQADSQPLRHQGSPTFWFLFCFFTEESPGLRRVSGTGYIFIRYLLKECRFCSKSFINSTLPVRLAAEFVLCF